MQRRRANRCRNARRHIAKAIVTTPGKPVRNARRHIAKAIVTTPGIRAVAVEDLSLRNMLRSAKGAQEQSEANVRTKTGLNRSLSRAG